MIAGVVNSAGAAVEIAQLWRQIEDHITVDVDGAFVFVKDAVKFLESGPGHPAGHADEQILHIGDRLVAEVDAGEGLPGIHHHRMGAGGAGKVCCQLGRSSSLTV